MFKEVTVGDTRYLITHPDPEIAWEIGVELTKMIGEPIAAMAQAGGDADKVVGALPFAVKSLLNRLDAKQSLGLIKRIFASVEIQGSTSESKKQILTDAVFKVHFRGKLGEMMKLVAATIEFTHADFFAAITDGIAEAMKKVH